MVSSVLVTQAMFRYSRCSLNRIFSAQETGLFSSGPADTGCRPLCSPALLACRLGGTQAVGHSLGLMLAALPSKRLSVEDMPHLLALVSPSAFHASPVHINRFTPRETRKVHGACPTARLSNGEHLRRSPTLGLAN